MDERHANQDRAKSQAGNKRKASADQPESSITAAATQKPGKIPKGNCYNCGKPGHFSNMCKAPRKPKANPDHSSAECYNCHKKGHYSRNCPLKQNAQVAHVYDGETPPAITDGSGKPDVLGGTLTIKNIPVSVLFDTGASRSFISGNLVHKLKLKRRILK